MSKRSYYDPHNGQHYYSGGKRGAFDLDTPISDKDESYINQYNYTPSYNAYRQYLEEEKRRQREATQASLTGMITAGAQPNPASYLDEVNKPQVIDLRSADAARTERAVNRIKNEYDDEHNILNKLGLRKSEDLGKQADDIVVENYIPNSVKANDTNVLNQLDQKINRGRTLSPDEEVQYSEATLRKYYKQFPGLEKLVTERNDYHSAYNELSQTRGGVDGLTAYAWSADEKVRDAENRIKDLTGWDDDKLRTVMMYADRVQDRKDTLASAQKYEIDPNSSNDSQIVKGAANTAYALANNRFIPNLEAYLGNKESERPRGFGANIDSSYYRKINNSNSAVASTREAAERVASNTARPFVGEELAGKAGKAYGWLYDTGYSSADSMMGQVPAMVAQALATGLAGPAVGKAVGETVGLAPFYFKSYNQGYMEARNKGATEDEANWSGIASGVIEVATELIPMGNYLDNAAGKNASKSFIKTFINQAHEEGMEEAVGDIINELADLLIYRNDPEVQSDIERRVKEKGSYPAAVADFALEVLSDYASGFVSSAPSSLGSQGVGVYKYGKTTEGISKNALDIANNIKGDSEYEKSVKAQMEQYSKNPTRYIADNMAENTEEDRKRKAEVMELAKKEANGEKLTAGEKLFIQNAIAESAESEEQQAKEDAKAGKTENRMENRVPLKYQDKVSNWTEDEAREQLGKAAASGDAKAFVDAMRMTMNSTNKQVSEHADEIISIYADQARGNGISQQEIGKAKISEKKAYIAGLMGEELDKESLSDESKMAYNEGQQERLEEQTKTTVSSQAALQSAVVKNSEGNTVRLTGSFDEEGKIKTSDGKSVDVQDLNVNDDSMAVVKAYSYADNFKNVNTKNEFLNGIKDNTIIKEYAQDWQKDYDLAMSGVSDENIMQGYSRLDDAQRRSAIDAGRRDAKIKATNDINKAWGVVHKAEGIFYNESNIKDKKFIEFYDRVAARLGINLRVGKEESGARGNFDPRTNTITIDAKKAITVFHEIGEFTETYNKEGYDELKRIVADLSVKKFGADNYHNMLLAYRYTYGNFSNELEMQAKEEGKKFTPLDTDADEMSGEMFNDVIGAMLSTDKGAEAFAKYLTDNYDSKKAKSLGEKAADIVRKFADTIKKLASPGNNKLSGDYQKAVYQIADELAEHADKFIEVLDKAVQNYQSMATDDIGDGEKKFSISVEESVYSDGENNDISGADLLGTFRLYNLNKSYEDYVKNPKKYDKTKGRDVIIPIEGIGGGIDAIAIVGSKKGHLDVSKIYVISDDVYDRDLVGQVIIAGEKYGAKNSFYPTVNAAFCGGQGFTRYVRDYYKTDDRFGFEATRMDSFKDNGFGRNSLNRKGLNSQSTGGKSSMAQGSKLSLNVDSKGNKLSQDQISYFNQSKIRDKNGALKVMHHGTSAYGFDVFDIKKAKSAGLYGRGFYFSDDNAHAGQYGQTYDVYLNIVNPLSPGTKTITDDQMLKFINAVANDEDMGIENYGQNATPQSILKSLKGKDDFSALQDINATCIGDFASALKMFNRINGTSYDGISTPTETVAFYPNQIKEISNKKPTGADSIKFSLTVEESEDIKKKAKKSKSVDVTKDLIAVHNLGEEQLIETLKLQGLPSPSIAIIKSGMMHDKYGAISLVFDSNTIDPKVSKRNRVYGGDGWTPTFPAVEVKINRKVAEKIWDKIDSLVSATEQRSIGYANIDSDNMEDKANRNRGDIVDAYRDNKSVQYAFLKDNGIEIDVPMRDARLDDRFTNEQILAATKVIKSLKEAEDLRGGYSRFEDNPELVEKLRKALNDQFREKYADSAKKFKVLDKDLYEELSFSDFDFLTRGVYRYYKNGITQEMDSVEAKRAIDAAISENEVAYNKWLKDLFDGVIEKRGLRNNKDVFLPSGNRRSWEALHDEYNLENIVKIMNAQEERGEAAFFSQSAIQALSTKKFGSLDEIRQSAHQLYVENEEEHDKRVEEQSKRFTEICEAILDKSEPNSFIAFGRASDAIADAIREGKTVKGIDRVLREYRGLRISDHTAQDIVDLMNDIAENPTGYFEAKPRRPVWLEEIRKAVIPDNVSEDLIKALEDNNVPYEMYRYEDEGQRRDIISGMENVKFSIDVDEDRVYYAPRLRGSLEIVKNATDEEYRQMREDILEQMPWLRGTDTPLLRHTYDEEGNTYYWSAADGIHAQVEPLINKHWNTRTSQHWEWWLKDDKDEWPIDYGARYSLDVDSEGRELSEGQQRYFGSSKALNEDGALMRMFHGTKDGGFTVFDPEYSDDRISLFFSDNRHVSGTYADDPDARRIQVNENYPKEAIKTSQAAKEFLESIGYKVSSRQDSTSGIKLWSFSFPDGGESAEVTTNHFIEYAEGVRSNKRGLYEVYLNIENPLVIDAQGNYWNRLTGNRIGDLSFNGDWEVVDLSTIKTDNGKVQIVSDYVEPGIVTYEELADKFGEDFANVVKAGPNRADFNNVLFNNVNKTMIPNDTRTAAIMAKNSGHDGVIIKNVKDYAGAWFVPKEAKKPSTIMIAFSPEQVKDIDNLNPTSSEDIRYSLDLDDDPFLDIETILSENSSVRDSEEKAIDILEKGMEALKNKEVDVPKLRTLALKLRNEYGSTYNTNTFTENLRKAFAFMQTEDHVDYKTMMGILRDIARPVIEQSGEKIGEQEYKEFLSYFKDKKIKLTEKQKDEVKYTFGTYGAFRNAIMPITISDNGSSTLDQLWDEIVEQSGYVLDKDTVEGDMPLALLDTLQAMRPTVRNDFGGDIEDVSRDLAMRIVQEYIEGEASKQMKQEISEIRSRLKKDYQERYKELRGKVNAEVRARNKRRSENAKERELVRDLKNDIKTSANKLYTWIAKPTEGKSIPHTMMMPVTQFLQAIDFVDPVITFEDGKYKTKVLESYDVEDGHAKNFKYQEIEGETRAEVLQKFNEALGRGKGSKEQRAWSEKMQGVREIYDKVLKDSDFEDNSMNSLMQSLDAEGLAEELDDLLSSHRGEIDMNHLNSQELTLINNVIKNIFHAVNQGNKAFSSNVDIANLAQSTIQDAEGKEVKARGSIREGIHKMLRLDNVTPRTFFKLLGKRGHEVYKFFRDGLNTEIKDIKKASEFMSEISKDISKDEIKKWTGNNATVHEIALSSGSIKMTDGQIMSLYCTMRRNGASERVIGGIKPTDIISGNDRIRQNIVYLNESDFRKIESVLTPEQIEFAKKMQKYLAEDCSKDGNAVSMNMYGFKKYVDPTYYPWKVVPTSVASNNASADIPRYNGVERQGFTKDLKKGARNALVIDDIFNVFTDHVAGMARYHGYAAAVKDSLRWMNYKESYMEDGHSHSLNNKDAINALVGSDKGVSYIERLLLDINQANRSQYIGNFTDRLIGNYKAAAVGANLRVVAQQPTAYFRALNQIDAKYLLSVNPATAIRNIKRSQEESPISWWKSKGYYETNLGQPIKEIVTGIASWQEKAKDIMMSPAGWADDFTWGFLYTAVEKEQRDKLKGQNVSAEEFRKAVNDRFDEVVDNTQVVDSTLHRSQYMRSTDRLNKLQTAFMAEPTKSYNMLLEAFIEDMNAGKTLERTSRATTAFLISALATSAAAAVVDAMRKSKDDDEWWRVWLKNLHENIEDNMNPFNLLPVVKDLSAGIYNLVTGQSTFGQSGNRFDIEAITSFMTAAQEIGKKIEGESNKTGYGFALTLLKPLSQITGMPVYNLTKDTVALYNTFFKNIETTVNSQTAGRTEVKKEFVKDVDRERSEEALDEGIIDALNHGVSIYDLKGAVQSEYKNKYFDLYTEGKTEEALEVANLAARAYARMGLTDEEIDEIIFDWQEEVVTYAPLDKAIANGENILEEATKLKEFKDEEKIIKHLVDRYAETLAFEDTHDTDSHWRENVEKALHAIDPTLDFDDAHEEAIQKKKEQDEKNALKAHKSEMNSDFFDAVEKMDGSAGRKALEQMKSEGIEAKTVKASVSTRYHDLWKEAKTQAEKDKAKADWKSAYTLVCNVYGSDSKDLDKTWTDWEKKQD